MSDLVKRLNQTTADDLGDAPNHYSCLLGEAATRIEVLEAALRQARNRIEVLGVMFSDPKHYIANETTFLPEIDKVLEPEILESEARNAGPTA